MKKILISTLICLQLTSSALAITPIDESSISIDAPYAILMEKETGTVIYEKSADVTVPPASVTKVMTILLIVEAIESGVLTEETEITTSTYASGMGGSQIYLKEGEVMTLKDMLKSIVVGSANDAAVAVAEYLAGTEENFVKKMNERAAELGMVNTNFKNCTGLFDDDEHFTCARDVAIMSCELISHDYIKDYTCIWMDTVRDGEFGLSNTNKLINRYDGMTGLKTGYTSLAGHCLSATALRDGTEYVAVVLGAESSDGRFEDASVMLNYAFANYSLVSLKPEEAILPIKISLGETGSLQPMMADESKILLEKTQADAVTYIIELEESIEAPVAQGQVVGKITAQIGEQSIAEIELISQDAIDRLGITDLFTALLKLTYGKN